MKKAASTTSFLIAGILFALVTFSFVSEVHEQMEKNTPQAREQLFRDAENGIRTVGGDQGLDGKTQLLMMLAGGGFLVAGFALWPRERTT